MVKKSFLKSILVVLLALSFVSVPLSRVAAAGTIVDIAVGDGRFTTLVAAVVAADLAGALSGGEWTVFAPTDAAFAKLGLNADNIAGAFTKAQLTEILLYHVLPVEVSSYKALTLLGDVTMGSGETAVLKSFEGDIYINDDSKVIIPDVVASNGVIHAVDTVLLPAAFRTASEGVEEAMAPVATGNTIVDIAVGDGRFTTLVAAVVAADLAGALSGGEWTVFAPTDAAFAKLGLNAKNVAGAFTKAQLTDILLYHVLPVEVSSYKALTLLGDVTMGSGETAVLKSFEGDIYINDDAKVIIPDVVASNGVIHAVDTVILPPALASASTGMEQEMAPVAAGNTIVDIAVGDGRFTTLVASVVAADLAEALSGGEWTVFAPTDAAFAKLGLNAKNIAGAFTKAELTNILLYHVLPVEVSSYKALTLLGDVTMGNGQTANLKFFDGNIYINEDVKVIIPDVVASNGVIHAVDTVILP